MQVAVVGSANLDLVVPVRAHPRPGETVIGADLARIPGGKGANQAVACARLGAATSFIGSVGDDDAAKILREALAADGVDVSQVARRQGASGHAVIVVDAAGENTIVVSPGANAAMQPHDLPAAQISQADAVLLQLEIPIDTVTAAARQANGRVVLNPAPAAELPAELLNATDVLVPNQAELAQLTGQDSTPQTLDEVVDLARRLDGPATTVVTMGAAGAAAVAESDAWHVPAPPVTAVDTTAAGDTFCGALTVALTQHADLASAMSFANEAAAIAVSRRGAQPSIPTLQEVEDASNSDA